MERKKIEEGLKNCSTCYHTRQGRGGLLCTVFGTLVHRHDMIAKQFKCNYYAENRKVTR